MNAYLALNVNIGNVASSGINAATLATTYFDKLYNISNESAEKRYYTVVNCITDTTNVTTYVK